MQSPKDESTRVGGASNGKAPAPSVLFREQDLAGRLIYTTAHTTIHQAAYRYPGYLIVQPKSPAETLGALSAEALADFFGALLLAETFVQRVLQPERIYLLKFAEFVQQLHMHVVPRTALLGSAYTAATGQAHPYNGAELTAWLWAHHNELAFSEDALEMFVNGARDALGGA